jgi:aspartate aminotransferase
MMWFSSPCNPRICLQQRRINGISQSLEKYPHVYVVADEIYEHINFSGTFAALHLSRNVRKNNHRKWVAKAFAMTGWRIGYIGAPEFNSKACTKFKVK